MVVGLDAHFHMSSGKLLLAEDKPPPYSGGWNLDYNMTGFIVALRQTLVAWGLDLFQCITRGHAFFSLQLSFFCIFLARLLLLTVEALQGGVQEQSSNVTAYDLIIWMIANKAK